MSGLSTHVLDLVRGAPAVGVRVEVWRDGVKIGDAVTNSDGRCAGLEGEGGLKAGCYRLVFDLGAYFRAGGESSAFFDRVPVDFVISDAEKRYHVPLLASPFGYSTYRGS